MIVSIHTLLPADENEACSTMMFRISVNGTSHQVEVESETPLLWVLREEVGLTGTKYGCGIGQCGACTVLLDGLAVRSCGIPIESVGDAKIRTIEGLVEEPVGQRVIEAWIKHQVPQCGYCQPGQITAVTGKLMSEPQSSAEEVAEDLTNLCRCGTYNAMMDALRELCKA